MPENGTGEEVPWKSSLQGLGAEFLARRVFTIACEISLGQQRVPYLLQ